MEDFRVSVTVQEHAILASLQPLFEEADEKGLWFFHESNEAGEVWCSPEFLRVQHKKGELIWAPEHWELRSPAAYLKKLIMQAEATVKEYNEMAARLKQDTSLKLTKVVEGQGAANSA